MTHRYASRADLARGYTAAGLEDVEDALCARARDGFRLRRSVAPDPSIPIGASKLGGLPDVGPGFVWPSGRKPTLPDPFEPASMSVLADAGFDAAAWRDLPGPANAPLVFLAQLDLAELPVGGPSRPSAGLLSFFYDSWGACWDAYTGPADELEHHEPSGLADGIRVVYTPPEAALYRHDAPAHLSKVFAPARLAPVPIVSPPPLETLMNEAPELHARVRESSFDPWFQSEDGVGHQVFGWPCRNEQQGYSYAFAEGWELLLQLDWDPVVGFEWEDRGVLYFSIRTEDLAAGRFDRIHFVLET